MARDQNRGSGQRMPRRMDSDVSEDPYLNQQPGQEPVRCSDCGNVYRNQRWYHPENAPTDTGEDFGTTVCAGCKKVRDGSFAGVLTLHGGFLEQHYEELSHRIENRVEEEQMRNPLSKIVSVEVGAEDGNPSEVILRTTNSDLVEHLGRSLRQSYGGQLDINQSDNVTHANWERSDAD